MPSFLLLTETVFGEGCIEELGQRALAAGHRKAMIVTDPGVLAAGLVEYVTGSLKKAGVSYELYSRVSPNPRVSECEAGAAAIGAAGADLVVGVGGGSALDAAKAMALLHANGGRLRDWIPALGGKLPPGAMTPVYAVNTTCGTGAEISQGAVVTDDETRYKVILMRCAPQGAFLDPRMVATLSPQLTAASGMDALTHATESFVSPLATPFTEAFSVQAIRLIVPALRKAVSGPDRQAALETMLYASNIAGRSMAGRLGHVHGLAHAVGGRLDAPHGVLNAILLTWVLSYHRQALEKRLRELAHLMGINVFAMGDAEAAAQAISAIASLRKDVGLPDRLSQVGVREEHIPQLADDVMATQERFLVVPRQATRDDVVAMYKDAL